MVFGYYADMNQCIFFLQFCGCYGPLCHLELRSFYLFDHALFCSKQQFCETHLFSITDHDDLLLAAGIVCQVINRCPFVSELSVGQVQNLGLMHFARIGENADFTGVHAVDYVLILAVSRLFVPFVSSDIYGLCISKAVH